MTQVAVREEQGQLIESVIVRGDLSKLTPAERTQYYVKVCESVGLNPLTKPFEYLTLNSRLTLYARRDATDQLRSIHGISVTGMVETERDGVYIVTVQVKNAAGRTDMAKGAVTINGLKGDALANAMMKAETKAKRRATLSICGLGFLDETEIETIPAPARKSSAAAKRDGDWSEFENALSECQSVVRLEALRREYEANVFPTWNRDWQASAIEEIEKRQAELTAENLAETFEASIETEEQAEPTRAEYIQLCHDRIAAFDDDVALLKWWNHAEEKAARRRFSLTKEEVQGLMARTMERRDEIINAKAAMRDKDGRPMTILEAG